MDFLAGDKISRFCNLLKTHDSKKEITIGE